MPKTACVTCGQSSGFPDYHMIRACGVPPEVTAAIKAFAAENGVRWKSKLCELWFQGKDEGELRRARNLIGPKNLYKIKL